MAKDMKLEKEAREAVKKGIDKLAKSVQMTLGPRGRSVAIEKSYGAPQVTFDGVTVAKEIELEVKKALAKKEGLDVSEDDNVVFDGSEEEIILEDLDDDK